MGPFSLRNVQSHNGHHVPHMEKSWPQLQRGSCGSKRTRKVLNPNFLFAPQSIGSLTSQVPSERKLKLSMCKDRSGDLYLNGEQRPGKDKETNLTYANSRYTNPFLRVSFSLLFSTRWRKHVEGMAAD